MFDKLALQYNAVFCKCVLEQSCFGLCIQVVNPLSAVASLNDLKNYWPRRMPWDVRSTSGLTQKCCQVTLIFQQNLCPAVLAVLQLPREKRVDFFFKGANRRSSLNHLVADQSISALCHLLRLSYLEAILLGKS